MANANPNQKSEPKKKRSLGRWFKETFSELKKVSWPTFGKVVKQTGIVLAVVLFFFIVLLGMDLLLKELYNLLVTGLTSNTEALVYQSLMGAGRMLDPLRSVAMVGLL